MTKQISYEFADARTKNKYNRGTTWGRSVGKSYLGFKYGGSRTLCCQFRPFIRGLMSDVFDRAFRDFTGIVVKNNDPRMTEYCIDQNPIPII